MRLWSGWLAGRKSGERAETQSLSQAYRLVASKLPCNSGSNVSRRSPRPFTRSRSSQAKPDCSVTVCFQSFALRSINREIGGFSRIQYEVSGRQSSNGFVRDDYRTAPIVGGGPTQ